MTNDKIAALEAAAKNATSGEWTAKPEAGFSPGLSQVNVGNGAEEYSIASFVKDDDATFIALSSPAAILSLVARLREAEKLLLDLGPYMDSIICYASTCDEYEANRIARDARAYMEKHA